MNHWISIHSHLFTLSIHRFVHTVSFCSLQSSSAFNIEINAQTKISKSYKYQRTCIYFLNVFISNNAHIYLCNLRRQQQHCCSLWFYIRFSLCCTVFYACVACNEISSESRSWPSLGWKGFTTWWFFVLYLFYFIEYVCNTQHTHENREYFVLCIESKRCKILNQIHFHTTHARALHHIEWALATNFFF